MTALSYLANSIPWACVGLLAGYLLGRGVRDLGVLTTADSPKETDMARNRGIRAWLTRFSGIHLLGVVVFVLAAGTLVQGYVQNEQTQRVAECTRGYANGFADALDARSQANAAAQQALDELMTEVGQLTGGAATAESRAAFRDALNAYLSKRAEAKKQQQENPYPPPPRDVCG